MMSSPPDGVYFRYLWEFYSSLVVSSLGNQVPTDGVMVINVVGDLLFFYFFVLSLGLPCLCG